MEKSFADQCYEVLQNVPRGKVTTYKELALALNTKAYRAVGSALNKNKNAPRVPCHRVVNTNGKLGGYALGLKKKIEILESEGVEIIDNKIDLNKFGYKF